MSASIVNISLLLSTDTGLQNALQGVIANGITIDFNDTLLEDGITLASGRTCEINGALYRVEGGNFDVDLTAVTSDGVYYIYIEDTGSAITAKALTTVPSFNVPKAGFFSGNAKAFFRFTYTASSFELTNKATLIQTVGYVPSSISVTDITADEAILNKITQNGTSLKTKVIEIGYWDMQTADYTDVSHGLSTDFNKIRSVSITIRNDDESLLHSMSYSGELSMGGQVGVNRIDSSIIRIGRLTKEWQNDFAGSGTWENGYFNSINYSNASYNRGWVLITYEA